MNGVLVMRTVQVKPVKAVKADLTELGERRDKEGEREGATLREGRPGSARRQIVSSLSYGSPSHPWRHRDEIIKNNILGDSQSTNHSKRGEHREYGRRCCWIPNLL